MFVHVVHVKGANENIKDLFLHPNYLHVLKHMQPPTNIHTFKA